MRVLAAFLAILLMQPISGAWAKPNPKEKEQPMAMVTGPETGTYIQFGNDIARAAGQQGLKVEVKPSAGSIDNIRRITSSENAALGIVQSDVLGFLSRSRDESSQEIAKKLRMVFPFYHEEVHVLAAKSVRDFDALEGKRVVVGDEGSGSWLTAMNLFAIMGIAPKEYVRLTPPEGVVAVLQGKADAMIFVGGKPVKLFKNMEKLAQKGGNAKTMLSGVHFLPLTDLKILKEYAAASIDPKDYAFVSEPVPTVSVSSVLVSYDFSEGDDGYDQRRCEQIGKLAQSVEQKFGWLKSKGHAKWKEVDLNAGVTAWQRDDCAQTALAQPAAKAPEAKPLENELLKVIQQR